MFGYDNFVKHSGKLRTRQIIEHGNDKFAIFTHIKYISDISWLKLEKKDIDNINSGDIMQFMIIDNKVYQTIMKDDDFKHCWIENIYVIKYEPGMFNGTLRLT